MCRRADTMNVRTTEVQAAVQQLVMEQGEYAPLELLLATNRLAWEDYRAWREGRLEALDAVLADGNRETREWLEQAQAWAATLDLGAEPTVHHGWESNAGTVLAASADSALNALLNTRFRRHREHAQLDLSLDSGQTAAVNELLGALTARDAGAARRALDRLVRIGGFPGRDEVLVHVPREAGGIVGGMPFSSMRRTSSAFSPISTPIAAADWHMHRSLD